MALVNLPIGKGVHAEGDASSVRDGKSSYYINCYVDGENGIRRIPGWRELCDLGTSVPVRGLHFSPNMGRVFAVSDSTLFELLNNGTALEVATTTEMHVTYGGVDYYIDTAHPTRLYMGGLTAPHLTAGPPDEHITSINYVSGTYADEDYLQYCETDLTFVGIYKSTSPVLPTYNMINLVADDDLTYSIITTTTEVLGYDIAFEVSIYGGMAIEIPTGGEAAASVDLNANSPVAWSEDRDYVFFAASSPIYVIYGNTVTQLPSTAPQLVTTLGYLGGFLLSDNKDSAENDPGDTCYSDDRDHTYATWEYYNNSVAGDAFLSIVIQNNDWVYNIGSKTIEVTGTSADPALAFAVNKGRNYNFGALAAQSVVYDGISIYMLSEIAGARRVVAIAQNGEPAIISMPLSLPLQEFHHVEDAQGFLLTLDSNTFYAITFPQVEAYINDAYYANVTIAYHIQAKEWYILGEWDATNEVFGAMDITAAAYVEPWGKQLIGTSDGRILEFYTPEPRDIGNSVFTHQWRSDGKATWTDGRTLTLSDASMTTRPRKQSACGIYYERQHKFAYEDDTADGNTFRCEFVTGHINHGKSGQAKRSNAYWYDIKSGDDRALIVNKIEEDVTLLQR